MRSAASVVKGIKFDLSEIIEKWGLLEKGMTTKDLMRIERLLAAWINFPHAFQSLNQSIDGGAVSVHGRSGDQIKRWESSSQFLAQYLNHFLFPASGLLFANFDNYALFLGILFALMMLLPALYSYYHQYDRYSFVMRSTRKSEVATSPDESFEMSRVSKPMERSRVITIQDQ